MLNLYKSKKLKKHPIQRNEMQYRSLFFTLAFFHSILLGRYIFQNLGWNANYYFTNADFKAAENMLHIYLNEYKDTPWDALKSSIAEVCYSNHLIDRGDEHLLMTYYDHFFCDEACSNVKFSLSAVEKYHVPEDGPIESYVKSIQMFPSIDVAEVFGQHGNAEIPHRIQEGELLLRHLSEIQGEMVIHQDEIIEKQVMKMIGDLKQEIPRILNEEASRNILQDKPDPFNFILVQETKKYNILLKNVAKNLNDLEQSLSGKQHMTEYLEKLFKYVQNMQVPKEWQMVYVSLKPLGSWFQDLNERVKQFDEWISQVLPPIKLWLPGFTSPKSVLNATLLTVVKNTDVMFKDLEWEFHVSTLDEAHIKDAPTEGILVRGLFLEGAGWDKTNSLLVEPEPLHLITPMPVIHFKPVTESSMRGLYRCPCFYTPERIDKSGCSACLFSIELKTKKSKEHWIKRSTAVILCDKE